jgi:hypothetical protein
VKKVLAKLAISLAVVGLGLVLWAVFDWMSRVIGWLRFDVPIRSGTTVISFLASHQVQWAIEPHSWLGVHRSLESTMLAAGVASVGVFLIGVAFSLVGIFDLDIGTGTDPDEPSPR